jgi:DNA-binding response OmpR family regulator
MPKNGLSKILIADNDEDVLVALERVLESEGYATTTAVSHEEASKILSQNPIDLLVLDDYLADRDATEVLSELQVSRVAPLVVVTYHRRPSRSEQEQFCSLGASAVINKRAHSELVQVVGYLLRPHTEGRDEFDSIT